MTIKFDVFGFVQGVGFRPFVLKIAKKFKILGTVKNKGSMVEIYAQGKKKALEDFSKCLTSCLPKGAKILDISKKVIKNSKKYDDFKIIKSEANFDSLPLILPDIATCASCERELKDKNNRRYNHPFISCTVCGPRYSVIKKLPYDRPNTTMGKFPLCEDCSKEYTDVKDSRCHAQTIACKDCGPKLFFTKGNNPIKDAINALKAQKVIAVKNIGGFHLAALATSNKAAKDIRIIKARDKKPFAVMFKDINSIKKYAFLNKKEEELLLSDARPIVLLKKRADFPSEVCLESDYIGAFLPSNPVQILLLDSCQPLIMTSANVSNMPIITKNEDMLAFEKAHKKLYATLYHNRDILSPLDDSVARVIKDKTQILRRGRGYTPLPIKLNVSSKEPIFAAGADLKATFGVLIDNFAYLSQYLGDLENKESFDCYLKEKSRLCKVLNTSPKINACDMHPGYFSHIKSALKFQHHHAHIASVMAEHNLTGDVLGFSFDGTGYGTDKNTWGGEVLLCNKNKFKRVKSLKQAKLCGGSALPKDAKRVLNCYLANMGLYKEKTLIAALKNNINTTISTSMGRLFDAVCALLEIKNYNTYEGECAIALEKAARQAKEAYRLNFDNFDFELLINDIIKAKHKGANKNEIALGFHEAIATEILKTAKEFNIKQVALSGGVFANEILTTKAIELLTKSGFEVFINEIFPPNDSNIALGQLYLAAVNGG